MSRANTHRLSRVVLTLLAVCVLYTAPLHAAKFLSFWQLTENQPHVPNGGRANTISINPRNADQIFVASESGGLFRSDDRGFHWRHVDSLPVYFTEAVIHLPSNPDILLATAKADFKTVNGGGLWRSTNGGASWSQMVLMAPNFSGRLSAFEISVRPSDGNIFVGTSRGIFISSDLGVTWTFSDVFGGGQVASVLATSTTLLAGGPSGVRRFDTSTVPPQWVAVAGNVGGLGSNDLHALGRSPLSPSHAYLINASTALFHTEDGGRTWTQIPAAPSTAGSLCGGMTFIKTVQRTVGSNRFLFLYLGNRCWLHRLTAQVNAAGTSANHSGTWQRSEIDHPDTRDLAFIGTQPYLLGTDGGLHNTNDSGVHWNFVGGGSAGYNALQLTEVKGQAVGPNATTDLYFGTQDNNLWASTIWGAIHALYGSEGFYIEAERKVDFEADSKIAYVACGGCANKISGRHFDNDVPWNNAPGAPPTPQSAPAILRRSTYIQGVNAGTLAAGLALTEDTGATWRQFAVFDQSRRDQPKVGRSGDGDPLLTSIVYQAFRSNASAPQVGEVNRLMRIHKRLLSSGNGTVFFPAMNNFGGLGLNPTMFVSYQVYGIDPGNAFHVIAADVVNQRMMETRDGGENWTEIPGLTNLVTDNGRLRFRTDLSGGTGNQIFSNITAVSFSPQDPNLVLIGNSEGGVFISNDNGGTWKKIPGTDPATYITSFFWQNANTVYISTYGRGLWKLRNVKVALPSAFDDLCGTGCDVVSNDGSPGRPPFAGGVFVHEGTVLGAKTNGGQLREVFVSSGSSVAFIGDDTDPQWDITITEAEFVDPKELEKLPVPPKGWMTRGLVFTKDDKLTGTVFADSVLSLVPPVSAEDYGGSTKSPTKGKPYITMTSAVLANETFELAAVDFSPGKPYEIFIDGASTKKTVTADSTGAFLAKVSAPTAYGYHLVEVHPAGDTETVIDSSMLIVRHNDE